MSETRVYEVTYILTPDLDQPVYSELKSKFDALIADQKGTVSHEEVWGMRKLAYEIEGKQTGYYVFQEIRSDNPELVGKLEQELTYDERIIRFLTVKLDKYAQQYNDKRKLKAKQHA